jgi:hypothetical protein
MKMAYLFVLGALAVASGISATPHRITVPAHLEYCVVSRPIDASHYELPEVREALFQELYKQIEKAALAAGLPSIGVAFVDAVMPGSAGPDPNTSEKTYIVSECVVVPASGNPPLPDPGIRQVSERTLTAAICSSTSIEACKQDLEKAVLQENNSAAGATRPIIWRTRPALSAEDSVDNLVLSMSDAKLRKLKETSPAVTVQNDFFILSAELAAASN